ncbi:cytochrome c biogenesis CcdA family protein [Ilumatobacter coccineus]|uniref:Putative cytochrome c biogenesis protein n=1 Tax=Ilumatobacter coccineus (strain NBRC 103263 / KCTC 29153 / YM16-304) TaxID=1313172 RepID=A0A6C7EEL9_ILUCY|nr:cytochrome c biogenesis CcdA family protein [Ilumatobacter coccineus]BAN03495.1 putative cytochrome c biogenesis protein [Ilumatobacter coccineus YM16-304]
MIDAPIALAFAAGMIATINPCGFALLPAYVGAFVAGDDTTARSDHRIARAVGVSAAVSAGFAAMFILVGVVFSSASTELRQQMPWVTIAVGLAMAAMGIAALAGWRPRLPFQRRASAQRNDALGMATFGFGYALVSLSCTLGPFLSVSTFAMQRSFVGGIATYVTYAAGMGSVILALSVSAALAHDSFVDALRNVSKHASRLAGVLLLLSGSYAIWYGRFELSVYDGNQSRDALVDAGTNLQTRFIVVTESVGATRIGLAIMIATGAAYAALRLRRVRHVATLEHTAPTSRETTTTP